MAHTGAVCLRGTPMRVQNSKDLGEPGSNRGWLWVAFGHTSGAGWKILEHGKTSTGVRLNVTHTHTFHLSIPAPLHKGVTVLD